MTDFFISYTGVDRPWAEWIAWQLEAVGYTTVNQAWDFRPGGNFVLDMQRAAAESERTIAVLSSAYLQSGFTAAEWSTAFARDPTGMQGLLLPVRIQDCAPQGLLPQIVYIDLVGLDTEAARDTLLAGVQRQRAKPTREPGFPGHHPGPVTKPPLFPGAIPHNIPFLGAGHFVSRQADLAANVVTDGQLRRNRSQMLEKVRLIWIKGLLEPSLYPLARIELGLATKPDAVELPFDVFVQRPQQAQQPFPTGTPISHIFDEAGKALLILGEPGAGKTTLLLELTRELLDRAQQNEHHLIPVVFNLSSWAEQRLALTDWLMDELNKRYDVPRKLAKTWVDAGLILPLLDGLDEVAADHREACVETINAFLSEHGLLPLAVCCRVADYEVLTVRLRLPSAVIIRSLSRQQVQNYIEQGGAALAGLHTVLQADEILWEMLNTPLMLSIAALAYKGRSADEILCFGTGEAHRTQLFGAYTDAMFHRRTRTTPYTREQTEHWLTWLARAMKDHNQSIFYVERMQPNWVTDPRQQRIIRYIRDLMEYMLLWVPLLGVLRELDVRLPTPSIWLFGIAGVSCLLVLLLRNPSPSVEEIKCVEKIRWSWSAVAWKRLILFIALTAGLLCGLVGGLHFGLVGSLIGGLLGGLLGGLTSLWGLFFSGQPAGFTVGDIAVRSFPNEGIKRSMQNSLIGGLGFGLFGLLHLGDGLGNVLFYGLGYGAIAGLVFGGHACLYHFALRLVLWHNNFAPFNYIRFLDYAAARIFLHKVGGGYVFVDRLLLEYFAAMPQTSAERHNCNTHG